MLFRSRIDRIGLLAALPDLQMQVVAGRVAGRANVADQLALLDILALSLIHI